MVNKGNVGIAGSASKRSSQPASMFTRQDLFGAALSLNALRDSDSLYNSLIDATTHFSGAQRVLLVLNRPDGLWSVGSLVPPGEDAGALLHGVTPWLLDAG